MDQPGNTAHGNRLTRLDVTGAITAHITGKAAPGIDGHALAEIYNFVMRKTGANRSDIAYAGGNTWTER